jgi:hypothetical protein
VARTIAPCTATVMKPAERRVAMWNIVIAVSSAPRISTM